MPTALTGSSAGYDPTVAVATTGPADGEGIDAADLNVPLQDILDALEYLRTIGPRVYAAVTTWTLCGVFDDTTGAGNAQRRFYMGVSGDFAIVLNATWSEGGGLWTQEEAALPSTRAVLDGTGDLRLEFRAAGSAAWADGAWSNTIIFDAVNGTLFSDAAISTNTTVTAASNVVSSGGDVTASAGKVQAQGDPASDAGRVECLQFVTTTGGAPTGTKGAAMNNGAGDGSVTITGTDVKGLITVITGAAVNAAAGQNITVVSFNKAYPAAPVVQIYPTNATAADLATQPYVSSTANDFTITIGGSPLTAGTITYGWNFHVIG